MSADTRRHQSGSTSIVGFGVVLIGASATLPIFVLALESIFAHGISATLTSNYALFSQVSGALANSAICAATSSAIGVLMAWTLAFGSRDIKPLIALALGLLFFPGLVMALGFQYAIHDLVAESYIEEGKTVALLVTMVGYILPYQLLIALDFRRSLAMSEVRASRELMNRLGRCRYWFVRLRWPSIGMGIVGAALATTEVHRNQILGTDLFGFGMDYFGPWFVNKFQATGLTSNVFSAIAAALFAIFLLCSSRDKRPKGTWKRKLGVSL